MFEAVPDPFDGKTLEEEVSGSMTVKKPDPSEFWRNRKSHLEELLRCTIPPLVAVRIHPQKKVVNIRAGQAGQNVYDTWLKMTLEQALLLSFFPGDYPKPPQDLTISAGTLLTGHRVIILEASAGRGSIYSRSQIVFKPEP